MLRRATSFMMCALMVATVLMAVGPADVSASIIMTENCVMTYNGDWNHIDGSSSVVTDSAGNVYVTGDSYRAAGSNNDDIVTIAYDPTCGRLWTSVYDSGFWDFPQKIAVDESSGSVHVLVAGYSRLTSGRSDYVTIAYDEMGNQLWVRTYDGPVGGVDKLSDMVVDQAGNIYITGSSDGWSTLSDFATVAYDPNGQLLWEARYDGPQGRLDRANAIDVDESGNIYVTGATSNNIPEDRTFVGDFTTVSYDQSGNQRWVKFYDGPGMNNDIVQDIEVDKYTGNIIITGMSVGTGATGIDYATISYDSMGECLWVARYDGDKGAKGDVAKAIATDANGNVYVTGESQKTGIYANVLESDFATISYGASGNLRWVATFDNTDDQRDYPISVTIDAIGTLYVTGVTQGSDFSKFATVAYDTNGDELWRALYAEQSYAMATDIATDSNGNVYVTGWANVLHPGGANKDFATVKYATGPNQPPVASAGGPYSADEGDPISLDASASWDPEGNPLQYRWDFNDDGIFDTGWSTDPLLVHAYLDDYTGVLVLQVWDGNSVDTDTAQVMVQNVPPTVEIGRRYDFELIDDEWGASGEWMRLNSGAECPTGCWHYPTSLTGGSGVLGSQRSFDYTFGGTKVFKISIRHKLDLSSGRFGPDTAIITIRQGSTSIVSEVLDTSDNTAGAWETRTYDLSGDMVEANTPITVSFELRVRAPDNENQGWHVDYVDIIGLDTFNTGSLETIHFRSDVHDPGADTLTYDWQFSDGSSSSEPNPDRNIGGGYPKEAHLTVTDDDGGVGEDHGVGSVLILPVDPDNQVNAIISEVSGMPGHYFDKNPDQRKNALLNKFEAVKKQIEHGDVQGATNKMVNDIWPKMDGSFGGDPKDDWIVDSQEQLAMGLAMYELIMTLS